MNSEEKCNFYLRKIREEWIDDGYASDDYSLQTAVMLSESKERAYIPPEIKKILKTYEERIQIPHDDMIELLTFKSDIASIIKTSYVAYCAKR